MRLVLMGMPGVGKGTQAVRLRDRAELLHVSTGDILRESVQQGLELGKRVQGCLDSGSLVPDELIGDLIAERLSQKDAGNGFILDGFPRTLEQVAILDRVLSRLEVGLDGVYLLTAPEREIVRRLSGRRVCPSCGEVFHLESRPPRAAGECDACGAALVQRPDDSENVIRDRLEVYRRQTLPIAEEYRERGMLHEIDGTGEPGDVFERMWKELQAS